jgi:hypothetical protein
MRKKTIIGVVCSLATAACGSDSDLTQLDPARVQLEPASPQPEEALTPLEAGAEQGEFAPAPDLVATTLGIQGDDLVLDVGNLTDQPGELRLSALVNNPEALFYTDNAAVVALAPHEKRQIRLSPADVDGLNLRVDEWTDARVNYTIHFADLREDGDTLSVFVEQGLPAPARDVVASGKVYGLPGGAPEVAEGELDSEVDKAGTFQICFNNLVTHLGSFDSTGFDAGVDFLRSQTDRYAARGQGIFWTIGALPPTPPGGFGVMNYLDSQGCKTFTRTTGTWSFILFTDSRDYPVSGMRLTGRVRQNSTIASANVSITVPSSGNPATVNVVNPAGEMTYVQTAFVTATHALQRYNGLIGGNFLQKSLSLQLGAADNFTRPSLITLTNDGARRRSTVAHEVGHFVHRGYMTASGDLTYCTPGNGTPDCAVPRADGCLRNTGDVHSLVSIEWNSGAHAEGIANFFAAYAMNDPAPVGGRPANCNFADLNTSCETGGLTMSACTEWGNDMFFNTSIELDWARTYWDFITDQGQSMLTYLQAEQGITGWNRVNHIDQIVGAIGNQFQWAAEENLWTVGKPLH